MKTLKIKNGIWILPVRGRPEGVARLRDSIRWSDFRARIVALVDPDDPELSRILKEIPFHWHVEYCARDQSTAEKINKAVELFPEESFYGLLANDLEIRKPNSLAALAENCPDFGLSYCDDSIHGIRLATHPCVGGELVRALGWWAYPEAKHNGIDVYLTNTALECAGCVYVKEAYFHHYHHSHARSLYDDVYKRADDYKKKDRKASIQWDKKDFAASVERVKAAMRRLNDPVI